MTLFCAHIPLLILRYSKYLIVRLQQPLFDSSIKQRRAIWRNFQRAVDVTYGLE